MKRLPLGVLVIVLVAAIWGLVAKLAVPPPLASSGKGSPGGQPSTETELSGPDQAPDQTLAEAYESQVPIVVVVRPPLTRLEHSRKRIADCLAEVRELREARERYKPWNRALWVYGEAFVLQAVADGNTRPVPEVSPQVFQWSPNDYDTENNTVLAYDGRLAIVPTIDRPGYSEFLEAKGRHGNPEVRRRAGKSQAMADSLLLMPDSIFAGFEQTCLNAIAAIDQGLIPPLED
jgi:hypothetical protein